MSEDSWDQFIHLLMKAKSTEEFRDLLDVFLTMSEKETMVGRYEIVRALLQKEKSQREISQDLKQSIAKITCGSNALKRASKNALAFLQKELG